jgi:CDP-diacylglycerol--glycerol-3-phosphate 3-phosphatidyltransferase
MLTGLLERFDRWGVSPDAITWASLVPAIACMVAAATGHFILSAALLALSGVCDFVDGALARRTGRESTYGALIDSSVDRLCDAAPLSGLVIVLGPHGAWMAIPLLALLSGFSISDVRARAEGLGIALPWLWMRRAERLTLVGVALLLAPFDFAGVAVPMPLALGVLALAGILGMAAFVHALRAARAAAE